MTSGPFDDRDGSRWAAAPTPDQSAVGDGFAAAGTVVDEATIVEVVMADLVEQLLARPGLYVGVQTRPGDTSDEPPGVARIEVTPLPGGSGVMLAYEVLAPSGELAHHEHAVLARSSTGLVLVTSHTHADITTVIAEDGSGHFPAAEGTAPFPMAVDLDVPATGHLVYKWSYGWADQPLAVRDVGDVHAVS